LIHHFGSAEGLQTAVVRSMAVELRAALTHRESEIRDLASARQFIDMVFDAFGAGGAGRLTAWIALSHSQVGMTELADIVAEFAREMADPAIPQDVASANFVTVVSLALGDSLAG